MVDTVMGEEESNNDEASASPMWKFLNSEYDYKRPKRGDIMYAEVLRIDDDEIIVDIGGKSEGVVPSADLERMGEEALAGIEVGDKVPVYVLRPESADGDVIVSLNMARTMEDWRKAEKLFEEGGVFEGPVAGHNKGGLLVYYGRIRGFIPASQLSGLSRRSSHDERMTMLSKMEGQKLLLKVIEVDRERRRLIFSERAASREWREQRKEELLDELQEGDIRPGTVRNLCEFGAFVDLGGADGLIHISELSWQRVKHAREVLGVGDEVEVYVLRVDRDRKRIGLSLKRLQADPWHIAEETYEPGQVVKGEVTNIVDFGAFARIEDGIEGLIHVSELSDGDFAPRDLVREGEVLYLKILSIDADRQRMGLSLKQAPSREEIEGDPAYAELAEEAEADREAEAQLAEAGEAVFEGAEGPEGELDLEEPVSVVTEIEVGVEEAAAESEEYGAAVELEEPADVVAPAEAELEEEAAVEAEEDLEAATEVEEPDVAEAEAELEEKAEAEEVLDAVAELEEPAPDVGEAEAELEEKAAAEAEEDLEAVVEVEETVPDIAEAEAEVEGESEDRVDVVTSGEAELEEEAAAEAEEDLEAVAELEEPVPDVAEAEVELEEEAASEAEEDLEAVLEADETVPDIAEAEVEIEVEPEEPEDVVSVDEADTEEEAEAQAEEELEESPAPEELAEPSAEPIGEQEESTGADLGETEEDEDD
jgi:small subunit ribosomal protein S1